MNLIDDLNRATRTADLMSGKRCPACDWLEHEPPGERRDAVSVALAGTIGQRTLSDIFRKHDIPVGREAIAVHRKEGHS